MDDQAASQQLFDELETRAQHAPHGPTIASQTSPEDAPSRHLELASPQFSLQRSTSLNTQKHADDDNAASEVAIKHCIYPSNTFVEEHARTSLGIESLDSHAITATSSPQLMTSSLSDPASASLKQGSTQRTKGKPQAYVKSSRNLPQGSITLQSRDAPVISPNEATSSCKGTTNRPKRQTQQESSVRPKVRKSNVHAIDTITAADRALETVRELHVPPDLREDGEFTQDEEETIRRAIHDFKQRKELDTVDLVEIIQWTYDDVVGTDTWRSTAGRGDSSVRGVGLEQESREFWEEIRLTELIRKPERVRRHIRSQYHLYRLGGWTHAEDEQLKDLYELHPQKWKLISHIMGTRSMHDIQNRYRDYVRHGEKRNISVWSKEEEDLLVRAVTNVAQRDEDDRAAAGLPPRAEYLNRDINWPQVSIEMGGIRSRLQSSVKWTKMKAREKPPQLLIEIKPRTEQIADPSRMKKRTRPRKSIEGDLTQSDKRRKRRRITTNIFAPSAVEPGTPSLAHTTKEFADASEIDCMRMGDTFDLVYIVAELNNDVEEDIDWHVVAARMKNLWSIHTLQAALKELLDLHRKEKGEKESFQGIIKSVIDFLVAEHPGDLQDHYDSLADVDSDGDMGPVVEEGEEPAAANTKRKRKLGHFFSTTCTSTRVKSQKSVDKSDDTESEPKVQNVG